MLTNVNVFLFPYSYTILLPPESLNLMQSRTLTDTSLENYSVLMKDPIDLAGSEKEWLYDLRSHRRSLQSCSIHCTDKVSVHPSETDKLELKMTLELKRAVLIGCF